MTSTDPELPDYSDPPVVEVVFAVAPRPLPLSVVDLAAFAASALGDEFPIHQEQPPMRMAPETFDGTSQQLAPSLALLTGAPPLRLWFQSADQTRLVQLQRDWIACNWQKGSNHVTYPRYGTIEAFFLKTWDALVEFANNRGHGPVVVEQCELSYINHIVPGTVWDHHGQLDKVLRIAGKAGDFLPEPEDGQVVFRYRIPFEGRDAGRLYVQAVPAWRPLDQTPVIQLNMVARGAPLGPGREGIVDFFRLAHKWIVNGFAAVTTDDAQHTLWGKKS